MDRYPYLLVGLCALLVAGACTSDPSRNGPAPTVGALVAELPRPCPGLGAVPEDSEITFLADGRLFSVAPDGGGLRCVTRRAPVTQVAWGGEADRVLVGEVFALSDDFRTSIPSDGREATWSRPTGTSLIYISHDNTRLLKQPVDGKNPQDISFLTRHDDVTYHPAGTHIAVSGIGEDGTYGLFLASNEGRDPILLARGEDASSISGLTFSHDGGTLYFVADHGDHRHLHALGIASGRDAGTTEDPIVELGLETLDMSEGAINDVTVSEFSRKPLVAYETDCVIHVHDGRNVARTWEGGPARPAGWLPDGSLLVVQYAERCDETTGDLYLWPSTGERTLVARSVSGAGVRSRLPRPPPPPEPAPEVVA